MLLETIADVIDTRSFSNIWYWIVLAAVWSMATHFVLGVPSDLLARARQGDAQALADVEDLCRIKVLRLCRIGPLESLLRVGLTSTVLSLLAVSGFAYHVEFAQALFLLLFPLSLVGLLGGMTAQNMLRQNPGGVDLCRQLVRLKLSIGAISLVAIFVTAIWGMYRNLAMIGAFGF